MLIAVASLTAMSVPAQAATPPDDPVSASSAPGAPGAEPSYIVRFEPDTNVHAETVEATRDGAQVTTTLTRVFPGMVAQLSPAEAADLRADPSVAAVEADLPPLPAAP